MISSEKDLKTCTPDESVVKAAQKMREAHCGDVIVTSNEKVVGILTDRDLAIQCVAEGKAPETCKVKDYMTGDPVTLTTEDRGSEALEKMKSRGVSRVIVCDENGKPQGVVSADDLLGYISEELEKLASLSKSMQKKEVRKVA